MGAVPKQRVSRAHQGMRRQHHRVKTPQLMTCPRCRALKVTHEVCPNCGTYNGHQVIEIEDKSQRKSRQ
ncbi:MAG TPA: 50S ribosomal protein L32 [Thermomicrobiales bacterium]|nr:50S ribosomal protein L32 [Thermomicrobiales bacterium]HEX5504448.1 50S ribosomal protein L32 [Thermomicrobiales bacterium]